jgi:hypothetical protein
MRKGDQVIVLKGKYAGRRGRVALVRVRRGKQKVSVLLDRPAPGLLGPAILSPKQLAVTQHGFADFRR